MRSDYLVLLLIGLPFAADAAGNHARCMISISKQGSASQTVCGSQRLVEKCISESPGEPPMCSLAGKIVINASSVKLSAEFINFGLSAWIDSGDGNWQVIKVSQIGIDFPSDFHALVPVRDPAQQITGETALFSCTLFSEDDPRKNCP